MTFRERFIDLIRDPPHSDGPGTAWFSTAVYSTHCTMYSTHCTMYSTHCTEQCTVHTALNSVQYRHCTAPYTEQTQYTLCGNSAKSRSLSFLVGRRLVTDNFQRVQNLSRYWGSSGYLDTLASTSRYRVSPGYLEELLIVSKYRESPVFL